MGEVSPPDRVPDATRWLQGLFVCVHPRTEYQQDLREGYTRFGSYGNWA